MCKRTGGKKVGLCLRRYFIAIGLCRSGSNKEGHPGYLVADLLLLGEKPLANAHVSLVAGPGGPAKLEPYVPEDPRQ
jgi:hypothetical protein